MLFFDGALGLAFLALWVFCVFDVITTPESAVRNLPKLAWVLIVILLFDIGSVLWLVGGRPWTARVAAGSSTGAALGFGARPVAPRQRPTNPDDDEEFLAGLRARAQEQRRRAQERGDEAEDK